MSRQHHREAWARPLWDGTRAVALFNRGIRAAEVGVRWTDLGLPRDASLAVRDLWHHRDLGRHQGGLSAELPRHGAMLLRVGVPVPGSRAVENLTTHYRRKLREAQRP